VETISTFLSGKTPEQHEESLAESVLSTEIPFQDITNNETVHSTASLSHGRQAYRVNRRTKTFCWRSAAQTFRRSAPQLLTLPSGGALSESEAGDDLPRINDNEYYGGYEKW